MKNKNFTTFRHISHSLSPFSSLTLPHLPSLQRYSVQAWRKDEMWCWRYSSRTSTSVLNLSQHNESSDRLNNQLHTSTQPWQWLNLASLCMWTVSVFLCFEFSFCSTLFGLLFCFQLELLMTDQGCVFYMVNPVNLLKFKVLRCPWS